MFNVVAKIPAGKTITYKGVAVAIGHPLAFRAVGNALNKNRDFKNIPCHRVIRSSGEAGGYVRGRQKKVELLLVENVKFKNQNEK